MLNNVQKAMAIQLALDIDLGVIDLKETLIEIKKNKKLWTPILEFWGETNELTRNALYRLFFEQTLLKN